MDASSRGDRTQAPGTRCSGGAGGWLLRFAPMELSAWVGSLALGSLAWHLHGSPGAMAAGAVLGELLGFYGVAACRASGQKGARGILRELAREFALAEALDSLLVRPLAIHVAAGLLPPPLLALVFGGWAADLVFYAVVATARGRARPARWDPGARGHADATGSESW